jgi:hypothetical protein
VSRRRCRRASGGKADIPNSFAYVALFGWPVACVVLFILLPVEAAAIWSIVAGYLLLPSGLHVDLTMVPSIDKTSVAAVSTLLLCWMKGTHAPPPRQSWWLYLLGLAFVLAPIFTSFGNSYELQTAGTSIPGFYLPDAFKLAARNLIILAPLYVGARFLCTNEARALLLRAIVVAALIYSLPMLVEIRISPQLHRLVYGYFPHSFAQQIRDGGYRPVVFLEHGLQVALFASMAVIAALVATRAKWRILHVPAGWVAAYLSVILVLCKTLGALIYAGVLAPVILFTGPRSWTKVACFLLLTVCAYPALRTSGLIPVQRIAGAANSVSGDRALSFLSRVQNEDLLLAKANQKPLFGWGTWGRNRIYDSETGRDLSVTDGTWIIQYGMFGWLGYLSLFGLFAVGAIRAARAVGSQMKSENIVLGGLSLVLAANVIDLLPNSDLTPLTFLLAGSIASAVPEKSARRSARRRISESGATAVVPQ